MNQPPQTERRIVSKGKYAALMSKKAVLFLLGTLLSGWASLGGCVIGVFLACVIPIMWLHQWSNDPGTNLGVTGAGIVGCVILGLICLLIYRLGMGMSRKANAMGPIIPLTRANTADLPAPETLVRASSEPIQEQEAVLLRAATQSPQTPAEQLLRSIDE